MGKVVELKNEANEKEVNQPQKLSYDKLKQICDGLAQQNEALRNQLMQRNYGEAIKRIEFLFEIVKNQKEFATTPEGADLVTYAVTEIKNSLVPTEQEADE